jgi:hypothetical protein
VHEVGLDGAPFNLLTPHKLFRKALLDEHGIRFPEGRRRLEDHMMVVHAYFHARNMAILADYACYHWVHWGSGTNASYVAPDPAAYFSDVRDVLDVVDAHTEPGEFRDRLYGRWYRGKLLGRLGRNAFVGREPERSASRRGSMPRWDTTCASVRRSRGATTMTGWWHWPSTSGTSRRRRAFAGCAAMGRG